MSTHLRRSTIRGTAAVAIGATAAILLASCSGSTPSENSSSSEAAAPSEPTTISFWHSASGNAGEALEAQVATFNEDNEFGITVNAIYQGPYADSMAKLAAGVQSGDLPNLMQGSDVFTGYMIDSQLAITADELGERFGAYDVDDLVAPIRNYYTVDGALQSIPYQVSLPAIIVNNTVLTEAGIAAADIPTDLPGLLDTVETIHTETDLPGMAIYLTAWWNEQFTASYGLEYCTPENGVGADPATQVIADSPEVAETWQRIADLGASGAILNTGTESDASLGSVTSDGSAMMFASSSAIGNALDTGADISVLPFPVSADDGGSIVGGNSVWVIGEGSEENEQRATWEFAKYLGSTEVQADNFNTSGYLPTTTSAAESITDPEDYQTVLLEELSSTVANTATAGCHSGALGEVRQAVQPALESIMSGSPATGQLAPVTEGSEATIARYLERAQ